MNGINQTRTNTNLFPCNPSHMSETFWRAAIHGAITIFALERCGSTHNGISDEMYEWLPQQTMSLLRCSSSPRYVIYCYGQALKPAPNSVYTGGGAFFGMVTNYQIVSEIATRAVVRFNSAITNVVTFTPDPVSGNPIWFTAPVVTNNNAVIESFNILPPD